MANEIVKATSVDVPARNCLHWWSSRLVPTVPVGMPSRTLPRPLPSDLAAPEATQSVEEGIPTGTVGTSGET
jgi:hypothetical protein